LAIIFLENVTFFGLIINKKIFEKRNSNSLQKKVFCLVLLKMPQHVGCHLSWPQWRFHDLMVSNNISYYFLAYLLIDKNVGEQCKSRFKTRFKSLHCRLLRSPCKDYGLIRSKAELTATCKKGAPEEWTKFATTSKLKVTKILRDEHSKTVVHSFAKNTFCQTTKVWFWKILWWILNNQRASGLTKQTGIREGNH